MRGCSKAAVQHSLLVQIQEPRGIVLRPVVDISGLHVPPSNFRESKTRPDILTDVFVVPLLLNEIQDITVCGVVG